MSCLDLKSIHLKLSMKYFLSILFLFIFVLSTKAQLNLITLETENTPDGDAIIYSYSQASVNYTLVINFKDLVGYLTNVSNPHIINVNVGRNQITKLTRDKNASSRFLKYSYKYYAGSSFRKTPTIYPHYILPISPGKTTKISKVESISNFLGQKTGNQFFSQGFSYEYGDTICATRSGIVYNVNDQVKEGEGSGTIFTDNRNKIHILHKDGTLGYYTILAPIKTLVKNGDFVIPGQPIAIFNKLSNRYAMFFSVLYLDEEKIKEEVAKDIYNSLPVSYYLNENSISTKLVENQKYDSKVATAIIADELNKKEKKKYGFLN